MTLDTILAGLEHLRNLHAAAGGALHTASGIALLDYMWRESYEQALRAGQSAYNSGGDPDQAFRDSMAQSLGMSRDEFDSFWNSDYPFSGPGADDYKSNVLDPLDEYFSRFGGSR